MRLLFTLLLLLQFVFIKAQPVDSTNTREKIIHFCEGGTYLPDFMSENYYPKRKATSNLSEIPIGYYTKNKLGLIFDYKCRINLYKKWSVTAGLGYTFHKVEYYYPRDSVLLYKNDIEKCNWLDYSELLKNDKNRNFHKIYFPININYRIWKLDIGLGLYWYYTFNDNGENTSFISSIYNMPYISLRYFSGKNNSLALSIEVSNGMSVKIGYIF